MFRVLIAGAALLAAVPPCAAADPRGKALEELAGVLGGMHYVRSLCGYETQLWRNYMMELIRAEGGATDLRARLTAAFNDAYYARSKRYRSCSGDARADAASLAAEGERLTGALKVSRSGR